MRLWALGLLGCLVGLSASAGTLDLKSSLPDIHVTSVTTTYSGGTLTATNSNAPGGMFGVETNGAVGADFTIAGATFLLTSKIDSSGNLAAGTQSVSITGGTLLNSSMTPVLASPSITGTITDFGFAPGSTRLFEFLFTIDASNAGGFIPLGTKAGIILDYGSNAGGFGANFASTAGAGSVDVFATPTPATALGGVVLLGGVAVRRGFRRNRATA